MASNARLLRLLVVISLPWIVAAPTLWGLHLESAALREARGPLNHELLKAAAVERIVQDQARLRSHLLMHRFVIQTLEDGRGLPVGWLNLLGTLPPGVVLGQAEAYADGWRLEGRASTADDLAGTRAVLEAAGWRVTKAEVSEHDSGFGFVLEDAHHDAKREATP